MAALRWFALDSDFPGHPKTGKLCRELRDPNAGMYVIRLLAFCAKYAPDGKVPADELEHAAGWTKKPGRLAELLCAVGFIERDEAHDNSYTVHGWEERNGAHVRKAERDATKPRGNRANPPTVPPPSPAGPERDASGTGAGPAREITGQDRTGQEREASPAPPPIRLPSISTHLDGQCPKLAALLKRASFGVNVGRLAAPWGQAEALVEQLTVDAALAACEEAAPRSRGFPDSVPLAFVTSVLSDAAKRGRAAANPNAMQPVGQDWTAKL